LGQWWPGCLAKNYYKISFFTDSKSKFVIIYWSKIFERIIESSQVLWRNKIITRFRKWNLVDGPKLFLTIILGATIPIQSDKGRQARTLQSAIQQIKIKRFWRNPLLSLRKRRSKSQRSKGW